MKILTYIYLLVLTGINLLQGQTLRDSLEKKMAQQYRIKILAMSPKGNWVIAGKHYDMNRDTVEIISTNNKDAKPILITKILDIPSFLKEEAIISLLKDKALLVGLNNKNQKSFNNVKRVFASTDSGIFALLRTENKFSVHDLEGNPYYEIDSVSNVAKDNLTKIFAVRDGKNKYEVYDTSSKIKKKVYESLERIKRIEISESKHTLYIIEENKDDQTEQLVLLNIKTGEISKPNLKTISKGDYIAVSEMHEEGKYFVNAQTKIPRSKKIEIWYGNDGNLGNHQIGFDPIDKYWIITNNIKVNLIDNQDSKKIFLSGKDEYLFAFKIGKLQNYTGENQNVDLRILDLKNNIWKSLDVIKNAYFYLSKNGEFCIYRNLDNHWVLYNLSSKEKLLISDKNLEDPVFNETSSKIYFTSKSGMLIYDIKSRKIINTIGTNGQVVKILNKNQNGLIGSGYRIYQSYIKNEKQILLQSINKDINTASYYFFDMKNLKAIIKSSKDYIREFYYSNDAKIYVYTVENYNKPMSLYYVDDYKKEPIILITNENRDAAVRNLKNEIINYINSDYQKLKGILYYPTNFDPKKKYPMIVRIYQIQNDSANQYDIIGYNNPASFDLRALLDQGYFVYLPDIVFGPKGTGLSALDCVNKALDAIQNRPYIDQSKIGLTGHSHGGYETNFIATQSNRFAAYLSGAGNSDIVRSYFSYNYNFHSPFYWQYENGQYELKFPFSENKKLYFDNNPIYNAEKVNAPILLWTGKKDENIKWDQVMEFYIGLKRNKKDVIALFYPNQGHNPAFNSEDRKDLYYRTLEWWDYFLKDKTNIDWINKQMKKDAL